MSKIRHTWTERIAHKALLSRKPAMTIATWALIASFFLIINPQSFATEYGTGNGTYSDRVDSFSEYIVRNSVIHNVVGGEGYSALPIVTKGYPNGDYSYYADNYRQYGSNLAAQIGPLTLTSMILGAESEQDFKKVFGFLRIAQAVIFALLLSIFLYAFSRFYLLRSGWMAPLAIGASAGFVYFSENLYFVPVVLVAPAAYVAVSLVRRGKYSPWILLLLSVINFLRGYEFASVFALLTTFAVMTFVDGGWVAKVRAGGKAFVVVVVSFVIALFTHSLVLMSASGGASTWLEAIGIIFKGAQTRTLTTDGVEAPFSNQFFDALTLRWEQPAFQLAAGWPAITELAVIIALLAVCAIRIGRMTKLEAMIIAYGFLGYASWYVAGYQHIMWHAQYDWYIFALTLGVSATMLTMIYSDRLISWAAHHLEAH